MGLDKVKSQLDHPSLQNINEHSHPIIPYNMSYIARIDVPQRHNACFARMTLSYDSASGVRYSSIVRWAAR